MVIMKAFVAVNADATGDRFLTLTKGGVDYDYQAKVRQPAPAGIAFLTISSPITEVTAGEYFELDFAHDAVTSPLDVRSGPLNIWFSIEAVE